MSTAIVSKRVAGWLIGLSAASLVLAFVAAIYFDPAPSGEPSLHGSKTRGALGYRALGRFLEDLGYDVVSSRSEGLSASTGDALLLLLEPPANPDLLERRLASAEKALVVLPKRTGAIDSTLSPTRPDDWLERADLLPQAQVDEVLEMIGSSLRTVRPGTAPRFQSEQYPEPDLTDTQLLSPHDPLAWDTAGRYRPMWQTSAGPLVALRTTTDSRNLYVLSDPEPLQNHGLGRGANAAFTAALIERAAGGSRTVVIDETVHGEVIPDNLWSELGRFPLVLAVIHALLTLLVLFLHASRRFGGLLRDAPALAPGRMTLVRRTAELLLQTDRLSAALARYLLQQELHVASRLHAPLGNDERQRALRASSLDRLSEARGAGTPRLTELRDAVHALGTTPTAREATEVAARIHRWRSALLDRTARPHHQSPDHVP